MISTVMMTSSVFHAFDWLVSVDHPKASSKYKIASQLDQNLTFSV